MHENTKTHTDPPKNLKYSKDYNSKAKYAIRL